MCIRKLIVLVVMLCRAAPLAAAQPAERLSIDLPPARWQLLPEEVKAVYVGPDGRLWYQLDGDSKGRTDEQVRQALESEYRQLSPQIAGAALALLEPSGRAWFYVKTGREVWGYDGQQWTERKASPGSTFVGSCPTRGKVLDNLANRFVAGKTWLLEQSGIQIFDGQEWIYAALSARFDAQSQYPHFSVSPSGKFAVAVTPQFLPRSNYLQDPDLWVLAGDKWQKRPAPWTEGNTVVGTFCVTDNGTLWYVITGGQLHSVALFPDLDAVAGLIAKLDHDDFQVREQAFQALAELNQAILPQLEAASRAAASAEAKARLESLVNEIHKKNPPPRNQPVRTMPARIPAPRNQPITSIETKVGGCRVRNVKSLYQDEDGKLYVLAEEITRDGQPPANGLAIIERDGKTEVYPLAPRRSVTLGAPAQGRSPIRTGRGDALWISSYFDEYGAHRLDLAKREPPQPRIQPPDLQFGVLQAVTENGQVYLGRREPDPRARYAFGIGLFSPDIAEAQPPLVVRPEAVAWPEFVVGSDGAVWAVRKNQGVARYDGTKWELIYPDKQGLCLPALAGHKNVVLCRMDNEYALFKDDQLVAVAPLRNLIADHQATFATAFPPSFTPRQKQFRHWIAADAKGNIWLVENTKVGVCCNGRWLEVNQAFSAADSRGLGSCFLSAAGDGSKVYLAVLGFGSSYFGEIRDGKLELSDAPPGPLGMEISVGVRDHEGALWVPGYAERRTSNGGRVPPRRAFRVNERGLLQEFAEEGWPVLADRSNNVWLAQVKPAAIQCRFSIWRDGKIVQRLEIPGADETYEIFSDKANSVYVWTTRGLHHFVAATQDGRSSFRLDKTYPLPPLALFVPKPAYSDRLGLVIPTGRGATYELSFIKLPEE